MLFLENFAELQRCRGIALAVDFAEITDLRCDTESPYAKSIVGVLFITFPRRNDQNLAPPLLLPRQCFDVHLGSSDGAGIKAERNMNDLHRLGARRHRFES